MLSINSNIAALVAHHGLLRANADIGVRLERITTNLRINRASDDPVGFVKANRLSMELSGLRAAIDGAERGSTLISAIDAQLSAIADRLETLKALVAEQADNPGESPNERQLAIDAELGSIEAIANTAVFGGRRLLDGSLDYRLNNFNTDRLRQVHVHQADLAPGPINLALDVIQAAAKGTLYAPTTMGSFALGLLNEDVTLEISGPKGTKTLSFLAGASPFSMITAINQVRDQTGVEASATNYLGVSSLVFTTSDYGSDQTVSVKPVVGTGGAWLAFSPNTGPNAVSDTGSDAIGTVNGIPWTARGLNVSFSAAMVSFSAILSESFGTQVDLQPELLTVQGGGVAFQVGPGSTSNDRVSFGVRAMVPSRLGAILGVDKSPLVLSKLGSGQQLSIGSGSDPNDAVRVVEAAIAEVASVRTRLGAIDSTRLQGAVDSLQSAIEAATAGRAAIQDADIAAETAALVRAQILSQASISMIGTANQNAAALLRLLER